MRRSILLTSKRNRKPMFLVMRSGGVVLSRGLADSLGNKVSFIEDDATPGVIYLDSNTANVDALTITGEKQRRIKKSSALAHALKDRGFAVDTRLIVEKRDNELVLPYP